MNLFTPRPLFSPVSNAQFLIYQPVSQQYAQQTFSPQINLISTPVNTPISVVPIVPLNRNDVIIAPKNDNQDNSSLLGTYCSNNNNKNNNNNNENGISFKYTFINGAACPYQIVQPNYGDNINILNGNYNIENLSPEFFNKSDEFKTSIRLFIHHLELNEGEQSITAPSIALGIKRRRLYDVVNVFESVGCCRKCALDSVIWIGKSNIKNTFEMLIKQKNLYNPKKTLADLFPIDQCIGVSNLTASFVLLFFALKTDHLDLRYVAHFFSRKSSRYKTTLCKLYQISYIMNAIDLMNRTSQVCEVVITTRYFNIDIVPDSTEIKKDPISIQSLLVDDKNDELDVVLKRRKEFQQYFAENMKQ